MVGLGLKLHGAYFNTMVVSFSTWIVSHFVALGHLLKVNLFNNEIFTSNHCTLLSQVCFQGPSVIQKVNDVASSFENEA